MSGAQANQAKKQAKNAIHAMWKARICGVLKEKSLMLSALLAIFESRLKTKKAPVLSSHCWPDRTDAVVLVVAAPSLERRLDIREDRH
jgi:hypothetical protein